MDRLWMECGQLVGGICQRRWITCGKVKLYTSYPQLDVMEMFDILEIGGGKTLLGCLVEVSGCLSTYDIKPLSS